MLTTAPCSGVSPDLMGWLSLGMSQVTGWSGVATVIVGAGAPPPPPDDDFEHASRNAASDGKATAPAAVRTRKLRRLSDLLTCGRSIGLPVRGSIGTSGTAVSLRWLLAPRLERRIN